MKLMKLQVWPSHSAQRIANKIRNMQIFSIIHFPGETPAGGEPLALNSQCGEQFLAVSYAPLHKYSIL